MKIIRKIRIWLIQFIAGNSIPIVVNMRFYDCTLRIKYGDGNVIIRTYHNNTKSGLCAIEIITPED